MYLSTCLFATSLNLGAMIKNYYLYKCLKYLTHKYHQGSLEETHIPPSLHDMSTVRVTNLPKDVSLDGIVELFTAFGPILNYTQHNAHIDIQFQEIQDAQASIDNMTGFQYFDRYLHVSKVSEHNPLDTLESRKAIWDQDHEMNV